MPEPRSAISSNVQPCRGHRTAHEPVFALPDRPSGRDWTHGHRRQWCGLPSPAHEIGLAEAAQGRSVVALLLWVHRVGACPRAPSVVVFAAQSLRTRRPLEC